MATCHIPCSYVKILKSIQTFIYQKHEYLYAKSGDWCNFSCDQGKNLKDSMTCSKANRIRPIVWPSIQTGNTWKLRQTWVFFYFLKCPTFCYTPQNPWSYTKRANGDKEQINFRGKGIHWPHNCTNSPYTDGLLGLTKDIGEIITIGVTRENRENSGSTSEYWATL